jgi:hypothetical protein
MDSKRPFYLRHSASIRCAEWAPAASEERFFQNIRIPVGLQPTDLFRGESRDPLLNRSIAGSMDPGFRRECGFLVTNAIAQRAGISD